MNKQACHVCGVEIIPDKPVCIKCATQSVEKRFAKEQSKHADDDKKAPVRVAKAPQCKSKIIHIISMVLDDFYQFKATYEDLSKALIKADREILDLVEDLENAHEAVTGAIKCLDENNLSATQEMIDLQNANERFSAKSFHLFKKHTATIIGYTFAIVFFISLFLWLGVQ